MTQFLQAADEWDLERLYQNLADAKQQFAPHTQRGLTPVEKLHLRGLLCGYKPEEIAIKLYKSCKGVEVALSNTIYRYTEQLTGRDQNTLNNWRDIIDWLEGAGYKLPQPTQTDIDNLVQNVRQHCYEKIQNSYGKMQLLDVSQPVDVDNLYVEVNILEQITSWQWRELSDLLAEFNPDASNFDRWGLARVCEERIPGLKAIKKYSKLMVLGKPGSGKTTFLKHIAIQCNKGEFQSNQIPIFIPMKIFAEDIRDITDFDLLQYIHREFSSCGIDNPSQTEMILSQGRGLILLDGLDEVPEPDSDKVVRQIRRFVRQYHSNQFIITCRIAAFKYRFQEEGFTYVELADFDEEQIATFSRNWFIELFPNNRQKAKVLSSIFIEKLNLLKNHQIRELTVIPIWLHLTCLVFKNQAEFPYNRAKLYDQGLDILLRTWDEARGIQRDKVYRVLTVSRKKDLLSHIAAITFERGDYFFEQDKVQQLIADYLGNLPNSETNPYQLHLDSEAILKGIEGQHGLLVERAKGIYSFPNLTFQMYLTAQYVVKSCKLNHWGKMMSKITEFSWSEVFVIVVMIVEKADFILLSMKQQVDKIICVSDNLQQFLNWVKEKSISVEVPYKPAAVRAFYFALDGAFDHALNHALDHTLGYAFDNALDRALDPDPPLKRDLVPSIIYALNPALLPTLDRDLIRIFILLHDLLLNPILDLELRQALEKIKMKIPDSLRNKIISKEWWKTNLQSWADELKAVMIEYRNIGHDWQFSDEQKQLLKQYYDANKLLVDCLNSAANVTPTVRQEIEDTLLLPIVEIEKRGRS